MSLDIYNAAAFLEFKNVSLKVFSFVFSIYLAQNLKVASTGFNHVIFLRILCNYVLSIAQAKRHASCHVSILIILENPLFRETAVRKQKFVRKIFMIISVDCDLKMMPDAKNYIPCLDWWARSWFLCGHLKVLCRL